MPVEGLFNTTIDLLGKNIDLRTRSQNLITSNLANAETPGYTPKNLEFEQQLQSAVKKSSGRSVQLSGSGALTNAAHIPLRGGSTEQIGQVNGRVIETPAKTPGRDGNSVELENEMSRMMQNQVLFNASVQLLSKKFEGLRTALREGR
jgi:flagellar basal-body rod protein FlgB